MTGPEGGLDRRVTAVEGRVAQLEQNEGETRMLAAADGHVSHFGGTLKGNTKLLEALRKTQLEHDRKFATLRLELDAQGRVLGVHGRQLDVVERRLDEQRDLLRGLEDRVQGLDDRVGSLESEMRREFAAVHASMTRVVGLLERRPED